MEQGEVGSENERKNEMKNIEKYPNTKDALEAYNKLDFKKVPFYEWLELEYKDRTLLEAAKREREAGADKEAEIALLKAALSASNYELDLARSNSRAMYNRLNAENIRISEMYRETIQGLRAENTRLRAALKPILECKVMSAMTAEIEPGRSDYCASIIERSQRIYNSCN